MVKARLSKSKTNNAGIDTFIYLGLFIRGTRFIASLNSQYSLVTRLLGSDKKKQGKSDAISS